MLTKRLASFPDKIRKNSAIVSETILLIIDDFVL